MKSTHPLLFAVKRYALHDGPNIRTTIFFKGCPLHCFWCHNPESISPGVEIVTVNDLCIGCRECITGCPESALGFTPRGIERTNACTTCLECIEICPSLAHAGIGYFSSTDEVLAEIKKDLVFFDQSGGGVTFSGGEPLLQPEPLLLLLKECGKLDIHRVVDTTGFAPTDILLEVARHTDLFLYDLKHMDSNLHRQYTGVGNERILENLRRLTASGAQIQLRMPLLAGINDSEENITETAELAAGLQGITGIDILPYHHLASSKYRKLGGTYSAKKRYIPDEQCLSRVKTLFEKYGLTVRIGG